MHTVTTLGYGCSRDSCWIFTMNIQCLFHNFSFVWYIRMFLFISAPSICHRLIDFHCCYQHDGIFLRFHPLKVFCCWHCSEASNAHILHDVNRCISLDSIDAMHSIEKLSWKNFYRFFAFYLFWNPSKRKHTSQQ